MSQIALTKKVRFSRILVRLLFAPLLASATAQSEEELSFYGQRGVTEQQIPTPLKKPNASTFHRRVIAPPIETAPIKETAEVSSKVQNIEESHKVTKKIVPSDYTLTRNEQLLAKKADFYFKRSWRKETGLWDSVQGYHHTTMWDIASGIAATLALEALEMKSTEDVHFELERTLNTLKSMPLYKDTLPNREYDTKTGLPSGRLSLSSSNGSGWSALDIGRLLIWLKILESRHPELEDDVLEIVDNWDLSKAVHRGTLFGTNLYRGKEYYRQEGRNGYLQYAAKGFELFGHGIPLPDLEGFLDTVSIDDIDIEIDTRNVPFLTSDPYVLAELEFGEQPKWSQLNAFYRLHQKKWENSGDLTSYAEDAMNKNPWFAYNNIFYYGKPWTSVSPSGKTVENPQVLSNKVAFGFSVIFNDDFSSKLSESVLESSLQFRSIPTGIYANGGINSAMNINTNSLILVALWYKSSGKAPIYSPQ